MLHLVGETIDAKRAHYRARAGMLSPLVRGVYVESESDIETVILGHAVRIARYLYPSAYLSSASSLLLGPAPDGRLFISGRRNQRTRLRTLEIVQNTAPENPSIAPAVIGDDLGELHVDISSPRQRFLEAFRLRSEHAGAVTPEMRDRMAVRLIEEYGSPEAAAESVWALARGNGWYREGERAERFLLQRPATEVPPNKAALHLLVAWHGELLGDLTHDGFEWRWKPRKRAAPALVRENAPGKLPCFIESLLPEGWLAQILRESNQRETLRGGRRYMSNVSVAPSRTELAALPEDILSTPLEAFCEAGRFTGRYRGPGRGSIEETFERNLARLYSQPRTPRLSGVQIKAPMSLLADGTLLPASRPGVHARPQTRWNRGLRDVTRRGMALPGIWPCRRLRSAVLRIDRDARRHAPGIAGRTLRHPPGSGRPAPSCAGRLLLDPRPACLGKIRRHH